MASATAIALGRVGPSTLHARILLYVLTKCSVPYIAFRLRKVLYIIYLNYTVQQPIYSYRIELYTEYAVPVRLPDNVCSQCSTTRPVQITDAKFLCATYRFRYLRIGLPHPTTIQLPSMHHCHWPLRDAASMMVINKHGTVSPRPTTSRSDSDTLEANPNKVL